MNYYRPVDSNGRDGTFYVRSRLLKSHQELLFVDGVKYAIYGASDYSLWPLVEIPLHGLNHSTKQRALKIEMPKVRVTVEWTIKLIS